MHGRIFVLATGKVLEDGDYYITETYDYHF